MEIMMTLSSDQLARLRRVFLGLTGLTCLAFALGALTLGRPDPFSPLVPLGMGVIAALAIGGAAFIAGDAVASQTEDEGYDRDRSRAERWGYWVALLMYPIFGVALSFDWIEFPVAFAAMGTLTGATYLLVFVLLDARGAPLAEE